LRELSGHVEHAEQQSAQAIDRMGHEVMRIAQTLGQRVAVVETRNAEADHQAGGEMARIAEAIESRMRAADSAQAEALEKLGGEIGRIAERLAERIAASERRAATAIDEVGDQVARVTDKINQRYDKAATQLSDRIRQSEERTAKLLEEARETLDRRLIDTQRRNAIDAAVQAVEAPAARAPDFGGDAGDAGFSPAEPFHQAESFPLAEPVAPQGGGFNDDPFGPPMEPPRFEAGPEPAFPEDSPPAYAPPPPADSFDDFGPAPVQAGRSSTRELIEAARAAARQASAGDSRGRRGRATVDDYAGSAPAPALGPDDAPKGLGAFLGKRKKKKEAATLKTALLASGTAVVLSMTTVGLMWAAHEKTAGEAAPALPANLASADASAAQTSDADLLAQALTPEAPAADAAPAPPAAAPAKPAEAKPEPKPAETKTASAAPAPAAPGVDPQQLYSKAVGQIESGDATGVDALRRAANLGYAPAQFYLAKLHETGTAGVKKDPVEARRWTERAAMSGDRKAMHNLALYYFEGTGGAKNLTQAAAWFRKAADAGLTDSQYNLARLYEQGYGVAQNPAEAYKWYLIAAAGGDGEARKSAETLKNQLNPETQTAAQRSAAAFRPQTSNLASR
jgi:localization factor PodJL